MLGFFAINRVQSMMKERRSLEISCSKKKHVFF